MNNGKILIIGGAGFIGTHLTKKAIEKFQDVTVITLNDNSNYKDSDCTVIRCDVRDKDRLSSVLQSREFEYVINCSGYVDHSPLHIGGGEVIEQHFNGVLNIISSINRDSLKAFVQLGSSDEYGDNVSPQNEELRESPISPYSLSKMAATHLLQMLNKQDGFPAVIYRLFLVYGPGQSPARFIPHTIQSCLNDITFPVSEGHQLRDFCYIDDVTDAIINSLDNKRIHGELINLASGNAITIKEVVNEIQQMAGGGTPEFGKIPYRKGENKSLYANIDKAKGMLNWTPRINLEQGLKRTINYYKSVNQ